MAGYLFAGRVAAVILLLSIPVHCSPQLPPDIKICHRESNDFESCLKVAISDAVQKFAKGNENLGIPSLDPLHVDKLEISDGGPNAPLPFAVSLTNVSFYGISDNFALDTFEIQFNEKPHMKGTTTLKKVKIEGKYDLDGKVAMIQAKSKGHVTIDLGGLYAVVETNNERFMKKGTEFMRATDFRYEIQKLGSFVCSFQSSDGNKEMDAILTNMMNENWKDMWAGMGVTIVAAQKMIFEECYKRVFGRIPLDSIMPK